MLRVLRITIANVIEDTEYDFFGESGFGESGRHRLAFSLETVVWQVVFNALAVCISRVTFAVSADKVPHCALDWMFQ